MRFIWQNKPKDKDRLAKKPTAGATGGIEVHTQQKEMEDDLKRFFEAQDESKLSQAEKKERETFLNNLDKWDKSGDVAALRTTGRSAAQNEKNYLTKHSHLSKAYLKKTPGAGMEFEIDFKGNETAYWKVGLGDMLPPEVKKVEVTKADGSIVVAERKIDPASNRIGYFANGQYIAVFTGDKVKILETVTIPQSGNRETLREHVALYQGGGDTAELGAEQYFNTRTREVIPRTLGTPEEEKARRQRAALAPKEGPAMQLTSWTTVEINGQKYQRLTRPVLESMAKTAVEVQKYLVPMEFLGQRVRVNMLMRPYLEEANNRIKAAGLTYRIDPPPKRRGKVVGPGGVQCWSWREVNRPGKPVVMPAVSTGRPMSNHAWATAIDLNPARNPQGKSWYQCNKRTRVPIGIVRILQECGFYWGEKFPIKDPMHFELRVNPFTSKDILRSKSAKRYMAMAEEKFPNLTKASRDQWARMQKRAPARRAPARKAPKAAPARTVQRAPAETRQRPSSGAVVGVPPKYRRSPDKVAQSINRATGRWLPLIKASCKKHGISRYAPLVQSIMFMESGGKPNAQGKNPNGTYDRGLMQLNSAYFKHPNIMDPAVNIDMGVKNIARLIRVFNGNIVDAVAAYNCGHAEGQSKGRGKGKWGIPRTTKTIYVPLVLRNVKSLGMTDIPDHGNYSNTRYA